MPHVPGAPPSCGFLPPSGTILCPFCLAPSPIALTAAALNGTSVPGPAHPFDDGSCSKDWFHGLRSAGRATAAPPGVFPLLCGARYIVVGGQESGGIRLGKVYLCLVKHAQST